MSYKLKVAKKVFRFLKTQQIWLLDKFELQIDKLVENPYRNDLDIKKLKGQKDSYRLRIGNYRFLYKIEKDVLIIFMFDAGHRKDIYK